MRYLKQNTATRITVGPFLDKADGITPETALTATNEKITLCVDTAGVPTLVIDATATASGGDNDFVHITNDDAGFYDLELTAAQTNYVGRAILSITYATDHCPVFHEFTLLPANVYDSLLGSDLLDVNTAQWLGTACATPTTNGVPEVDVTYVAGSAASGTATPYLEGAVHVGAAATTTTFETDTAAIISKADDYYNGSKLAFTSGNLKGRAFAITDWVTATNVFTVDTMPEAPANDDTFIIID